MDHRTIDAQNIAERYVTGRLPVAEAAGFEEHYLDCPACCDRVEAAQRLQVGLRRLAEERAAGAGPVAGPVAGSVAGWRRSSRLAWAVAAGLAVALLPAGLAVREVGRLRTDLAATREALARRPGEAGGDLVAHRLDALAGELRQAKRDLGTEAAKRQALAEEVAAGRRALTSLPVLALTTVRGDTSGGPVRTLTLPREPGWIALWVEPGDADFPAYRATLTDSRGTAVFTASGLALNELGALLLTVHSSSLAAGLYRLDVEGVPAAGRPQLAGRYPLRVKVF